VSTGLHGCGGHHGQEVTPEPEADDEYIWPFTSWLAGHIITTFWLCGLYPSDTAQCGSLLLLRQDARMPADLMKRGPHTLSRT